MLNEGMFAGSAGWVLKPRGYRSESNERITRISDESQADAITHKCLSLSVDILAAQNLPLPVGDSKPAGLRPHVEKPEERSGAPIEGGGRSKEGEYKQRTKTSRGIDPDFGGERLDFSKVQGVVADLSFIRYVKIFFRDCLTRHHVTLRYVPFLLHWDGRIAGNSDENVCSGL